MSRKRIDFKPESGAGKARGAGMAAAEKTSSTEPAASPGGLATLDLPHDLDAWVSLESAEAEMFDPTLAPAPAAVAPLPPVVAASVASAPEANAPEPTTSVPKPTFVASRPAVPPVDAATAVRVALFAPALLGWYHFTAMMASARYPRR